MITLIAISHLHFRSIFLQALHPLFNFVCCCGGLVCLHCSSGTSWPPGYSSFFHNGICNGSTTFLTVLTIITTWAYLLAQLTGPAKWNPTSLALPRGSPLWGIIIQNKIAPLGARTAASLIHSLRPSWKMVAINKPVHAWEGGGWSPPLFPVQ